MTKVARFHAAEGPDHLSIDKESIGQPGKGEVRISMRAAGLNRSEWLFMHGQYLEEPNPPSRIGVEGAGVVEAVGEGVNDVKPGDEVCIWPTYSCADYGVIAESAIVPAHALVPKPDNLSFPEAAAIGMAYPTVYGGLVTMGGLKSGETAVITAASSGVGLAGVQVAKAQGATVIATSRTLDKADSIKAAGADHVIATDEEDLAERIMEITGGKGFDVAIDPVSGSFLEMLANAAAHEARIVEYGALSMAPATFPLFPAIAKGLQVMGFHVCWNLFDFPDRRAAAVADITKHISSGAYKPKLDKEFSLDEIADAYRYLASNTHEGKIIIRMNQ